MEEFKEGVVIPFQEGEAETPRQKIKKEEEQLLIRFGAKETPKGERTEIVEKIKELNKQREEIRERAEEEIRELGKDGIVPEEIIYKREFKDWQGICDDLRESYFEINQYPEKVALLEKIIDFKLDLRVFSGITKDLKDWDEAGRVMIISGKRELTGSGLPKPGSRLDEFNKKVEKKRALVEGLVSERG